MSSPLTSTIRELRHLLSQLERFITDTRAIDALVLDALGDGDFSTNALAALVHRRRCDVLSTLNLLQAANKVSRTPDGKRWVLHE